MYKNIKEAFKSIGVAYDDAMQGIMDKLLKCGYSEKGICRAMWQEKEALKEAGEKGTIEAIDTRNTGYTRKGERKHMREDEEGAGFNQVLMDAILNYARKK